MSYAAVRYQVTTLAQITRLTSSLYAAGYTLVGALLAGGPAAALGGRAWLAALAVVLLTAYGFVINDYRDAEVDRIGKPERPIPSGRIAPGAALALAGGLAGAGLAAAGALGPGMALFALAAALAAGLYSLALKGTVLAGNACMASLIGAIPLFGALAVGEAGPKVWTVAGLMWLFDLSHEILKTTADWEGDGRAGLRTVATAFGVAGAVRIFQATAFIFLAVALLPLALGLAGWPYAIALGLCAGGPTAWTLWLLARRTDDAAIALALRVMRFMWITNLLPILALAAA